MTVEPDYGDSMLRPEETRSQVDTPLLLYVAKHDGLTAYVLSNGDHDLVCSYLKRAGAIAAHIVRPIRLSSEDLVPEAELQSLELQVEQARDVVRKVAAKKFWPREIEASAAPKVADK